MYKLIAIDMDGTLLNSDKKVSKENIATINEAMKRGIRVAICTGRPYSGIEPYAKEIGLCKDDEYIISQNGSYVSNGNDTKTISAKYLNVEETNKILSYLEDKEIGVVLVTDKDYLAYNCEINEEMKRDADLVFKTIKMFDKSKDSIENLKLVKIMIMDNSHKIDNLIENMDKNIINSCYVVRSMPYLIEIMAKNVDKGYGLSKLAEHLNIDHKDIMVIGDELNDIGMFKVAGLGVAMANANIEIKRLADFITLSNDENGVSYAIDYFMK
ncbi:haloacid dehalogenase [Clostridium novyi A str. BKT29909]|uniref:Cof-type HAD-IIB family hydrolase n=1 Tax=Clostridium TaxID=1485 RepID=UPI0004D551A4|nr:MULTISPECIES: Cof-type HAD-IIB family hydrolase [Clostridium]KEH89724.1 haloacid dehalogenase [Clostridium novyi A str. 4540]KEH90859.1 haloacid dehalogenase [Clostridium novyi A str. BKT29909]KEH93864.1 haloacid dehalogenase [Clostridium botulinum C/D str. It1]